MAKKLFRILVDVTVDVDEDSPISGETLAYMVAEEIRKVPLVFNNTNPAGYMCIEVCDPFFHDLV
jgi:chromatin remodeling complex protein RSC6